MSVAAAAAVAEYYEDSLLRAATIARHRREMQAVMGRPHRPKPQPQTDRPLTPSASRGEERELGLEEESGGFSQWLRAIAECLTNKESQQFSRIWDPI